MTRAELREAIKTTEHAMAYLAKTYGEDVDMRPWVSNDHPLSQTHWLLVQGRMEAKKASKKPIWTPEQRRACSQRMTTRCHPRQTGAGEGASQVQIDDLASGGPGGHPATLGR